MSVCEQYKLPLEELECVRNSGEAKRLVGVQLEHEQQRVLWGGGSRGWEVDRTRLGLSFTEQLYWEFYVLLTVLLDLVLVNNQLDAQFFFRIYLFQFSTCFEHPCAHHQKNQLY